MHMCMCVRVFSHCCVMCGCGKKEKKIPPERVGTCTGMCVPQAMQQHTGIGRGGREENEKMMGGKECLGCFDC